jgi:hypothetical protein
MSKGNSSSKQESKTNVTNQQVATESGIAVGAGASANISITSSDAETTKNALIASAANNQSAFNFAGHAAEVAADTNRFATTAVRDIAGTSIEAQNALATKYTEHVSDTAAQNINLLQSIAQQQTDVGLKGLDVANEALNKSFAVSRAVAPQDANYTQTETSKYMLYAVIAVAVIFGLSTFLFRKRA